MPVFETKLFGEVPFEAESVLEFPLGLPGFNDRMRFVPVYSPENAPLIFLQSLEDQALCFITIPILAVDPQYRLKVNDEDLRLIDLDPSRSPRIGDDVICLSVLSIWETGPTANLLAPLVINQRTHKGVQAVAPESGYSHQFVLMSPQPSPQEEAAPQVAALC